MIMCHSCFQELTEAASETVATTVTTETSTMVTESNEGTKIKEEVTETVTTVTTTTTSSTVETTISGIKGKIHEYVCTRKLFRENLNMCIKSMLRQFCYDASDTVLTENNGVAQKCVANPILR